MMSLFRTRGSQIVQLVDRVSSISAKLDLVFNEAGCWELLTLHRKDKFGFMLQAATDLYLWSFPRPIYRSDTGERKTRTKEWTWMLRTVLLMPFILPHCQQHCPVARLLVSTFHPARSQPSSGEARQCAVGGGMESSAGPGAASSCPNTLLQLFKPSFGSAEALQSQPRVPSSHTNKRKGLAPNCCCITAPLAVPWPPVLLGHWQYCHRYCSGSWESSFLAMQE